MFGINVRLSRMPLKLALKISISLALEEEVMTKFFYNLNPSFTHQLYMHGFQQVGGQKSNNREYYHEFFLKDRFDLCKHIPRYDKGNKNTVSASHVEGQIPNFHSLPNLQDTTCLSLAYAAKDYIISPPTSVSRPKLVPYKVVSEYGA